MSKGKHNIELQHTTITEQTSLPRLINMYVLLVTFLLDVYNRYISTTTDDNNNNIMDGCMSCINKIILFKLGFGIDNTINSRRFCQVFHDRFRFFYLYTIEHSITFAYTLLSFSNFIIKVLQLATFNYHEFLTRLIHQNFLYYNKSTLLKENSLNLSHHLFKV